MKPINQAPIFPYLQIAFGAIMVSFSAVFVKLTSTGPDIDIFYRMFFGGIILLIIALSRREKLWVNWQTLFVMFFAGLMFSINLSIWHRSVDAIGPGLATIIVNLQVFVMVFVGIYFHREACSKQFCLAIPLAMLGMYLLIGHNWQHLSSDYKFGLALGFICTITYSSSATLHPFYSGIYNESKNPQKSNPLRLGDNRSALY